MTISFGSIGSGIDTTSIVTALVQASQGNLQAITNQSAKIKDAGTTLSDIGRTLGNLKSAADNLSSADGVSSYTASSSAPSVVASATGGAHPGAYKLEVSSLAAEQRTYSAVFASHADDLNQAGTFTINVGSGPTGHSATISVALTDSLDDIADKINGAGLQVSSSVFYDGSAYRLQVRGLDTGAANALTFSNGGSALDTALDLNGDGTHAAGGKTVQAATDAHLKIDGFDVTRSTNQITGALAGVTLALTDVTTAPVTVTVGSDSNSLAGKLSTFVGAFNSSINAIHSASGFGTQKATNPVLAGDSALRTINDRLDRVVASAVPGATGKYQSLADIGVSLNRDGTLALDSTKLSAAIASDPASVTALLARPKGSTTGGVMATLSDLATSFTQSDTGVLSIHQNSFTAQAKKLDENAQTESDRLDKYAANLKTQFAAMNATMGVNSLLQLQVSKMFG